MNVLKKLLASPLALTLMSAAASVSAALVFTLIFLPEIFSVDFALQLALAFVPAGLIVFLAAHRKRR